MKPIIKLRGIRRQLISKKEWTIVKMDQEKFGILMGAANRCVEEVVLQEPSGAINKEVIKTIQKIIGDWIDMREGVFVWNLFKN